MVTDLCLLILIGLLWGATNPFIRSGSEGIEKINCDCILKSFVYELWFLARRWKYVLPFILNQSGSIIYLVALQHINLSLAVPVTNALSFVFTAIVGHILGEATESKSVHIGILLVICGSTICVLDKV